MIKYDLVLKVKTTDNNLYNAVTSISPSSKNQADEILEKFKPLFTYRKILGLFIDGTAILARIIGAEQNFDVEIVDFLSLVIDTSFETAKSEKISNADTLEIAKNLLGGTVEDVFIDQVSYIQYENKPL